MNYSASYFRANMWTILDETKYNRSITTIWRRKKKEFYIIPAEVIKQKWLEKEFDYKDKWYYKNIETSLNKIWEKDETVYSINDIKNV